MSPANLIRVPALDDNYIWMLHNPSSNALAVIDPADAAAVMAALAEHGLEPTEIVNTHHHADHTAGNGGAMDKFGIPPIAPASETARIDNITQAVADGDDHHRRIRSPALKPWGIPPAISVIFCLTVSVITASGWSVTRSLPSAAAGFLKAVKDQMWQSMLAVRGLPENTVPLAAMNIPPPMRFMWKVSAGPATVWPRGLPKSAPARRQHPHPADTSVNRGGNNQLRIVMIPPSLV